jgi:hypothetical protein
VEATVVGQLTKKGSGRFGGGNRAFARPEEGRQVVGAGEDGAFSDIEAVGDAGVVEDGASELKVRVGNISVGVASGNEAVLDVFRKGHPPEDRLRNFGG